MGVLSEGLYLLGGDREVVVLGGQVGVVVGAEMVRSGAVTSSTEETLVRERILIGVLEDG